MSNWSNPKFIQFIFQIILLFIVVIVSIVNLSLGTAHYDVWLLLLSTCLGVIVPHPKIKKNVQLLSSPSLLSSTGLGDTMDNNSNEIITIHEEEKEDPKNE